MPISSSLRDFDSLLGDQFGGRIGPVGEIEDAKAVFISSNKAAPISSGTKAEFCKSR
jgi:hypothetical protein